MSTINEALRRYFGFERFNDGQREVIEHLMAGRSAAALFPTGGGKSLCYQLPGILLPGLTLVVSPLIALMKDQIDALSKRGIAAARLDSTLSADEYRHVLAQARLGTLKMLYVAPERFNNERFRETVERLPIALFAVDEAHCISEWGHNFRPDYLKLPAFANRCGAERVLALTATATEKVQEDICRTFNIAPQCAVRTGFYRPNLTVLTTPVTEQTRDAVLLSRLQDRSRGPTIVYVTLQRTAEDVATRLAAAGYPARAYHAGMKDEQRTHVQEWFMGSDDAVVVATIAFGMGVDKSNIRYVYHYNLPKSLENFAQEIGRAGRDGDPSTCEMFVCFDDLNTLENFVYSDTPTLEALQRFVGELFSQETDFDVNLNTLSSTHNIRPLVVRTLLTYLEIDGYLEGGTPFYSGYRFKPLQRSRDILARFQGERRQFIADIFRQARKARTWFDIDLAQAAQTITSSRERIIRALDYLGEQNLLEVRASGVRHRYRRIQSPQTINSLASDLHERASIREASELARLQQVLELASTDACQVGALAAHFGDVLTNPCGHCSWCLDGKAVEITERSPSDIDEKLFQKARALQQENAPILSDPRTLVHFLCGISSPSLSRARLTKHELFGALGHVPFKQLMDYASATM